MLKPETETLAPRVAQNLALNWYRHERFLSLRDVLDRLTISRSLLYELIKDPVFPFPSPVHIGRRSVWVEREVDAYMRGVIENEREDAH